MLSSNGEIHVTHKTSYPYNQWGIEDLAQEVGLSLLEKANFSKWDYPGYDNKRGYSRGNRTLNSTFPVGDSCTFKFCNERIPCFMNFFSYGKEEYSSAAPSPFYSEINPLFSSLASKERRTEQEQPKSMLH